MKKIFYLIAAVGIAWGAVSCDNEPKNPGDFSAVAYLNVGDLVSLSTGEVFPLKVTYSCDTLFFTEQTVRDTIKDAAGNVTEIVPRQVYHYASRPTHYYECEPLWLPTKADTFAIDVYTNAKWLTPEVPEREDATAMQWLYLYGNKTGGGDGTVKFRVPINRNANKAFYAYAVIYTSDSTVMYKVPLKQYGERSQN